MPQDRIIAGAAEDACGLNERASILGELHQFERAMTVDSLSEAIRLLESDCFDDLTAEHIRQVGEYRPIQVGEERFFERAWSRGKEVAAALGFAQYVGPEAVREDLVRLLENLAEYRGTWVEKRVPPCGGTTRSGQRGARGGGPGAATSASPRACRGTPPRRREPGQRC